MNNQFAGLVLASVVLTATSTTAMADSHDATATASFSDLTFTLIDLNPNDGITPGMTFAPGYSGDSTYADSQYADGTGGYPHYAANSSSDTFGAASSNGSLGTNVAIGSASGGYFSTTGGSLASTSVAAGSPGRYSVSEALASINGQFTLTANTLLVVTGMASVSAVTTPDYLVNVGFEQAVVSAQGKISGTNGGNVQSSSFTLSENVCNAYNCGTGAGSDSGLMNLSFANYGAQMATGNLYFNTDAYAYSTVMAAAVPEPASAAMLLAGLGAMGLMARRRRLH